MAALRAISRGGHGLDGSRPTASWLVLSTPLLPTETARHTRARQLPRENENRDKPSSKTAVGDCAHVPIFILGEVGLLLAVQGGGLVLVEGDVLELALHDVRARRDDAVHRAAGEVDLLLGAA